MSKSHWPWHSYLPEIISAGVVLLVLLAASVIGYKEWTFNKQCEAAGGVKINANGKWRCARPDAFIDIDGSK